MEREYILCGLSRLHICKLGRRKEYIPCNLKRKWSPSYATSVETGLDPM
jgi:hypothetical protein